MTTAPSDNKKITDRKAYALLTSTAAIWGFSWICGRVVSSAGVPAAYASLARFLFGSLGLALIMVVNRQWPRVGLGAGLRLLAMGFFGVFLYNICFFNGLRTVPAGRGALIVALQPSVVFLFSALFLKESATPVRIAGLALSLVGAAIVLAGGNPAALIQSGVGAGDLWILGCVLSWVAYTLLGRKATAQFPAGPATAYSTWAGTAMLAVAVAFDPASSPAWNLEVWLSVAFLGLAGTSLGFLMYVQGLAQVGASRASIFLNLVPVFGVVFSAVFLGEALGPATLLGGALVILGVRLLNRR